MAARIQVGQDVKVMSLIDAIRVAAHVCPGFVHAVMAGCQARMLRALRIQCTASD